MIDIKDMDLSQDVLDFLEELERVEEELDNHNGDTKKEIELLMKLSALNEKDFNDAVDTFEINVEELNNSEK